MRISRWIASLSGVVAVSLAFLVASSSAHPASAARPAASIKVGLITKTDTNPFFVKMKEGASKQAKALGVTLLTAAGKIDGDAATQITAIENMVSAGVKGILITPSNDSVVPAIKKARAASRRSCSSRAPRSGIRTRAKRTTSTASRRLSSVGQASSAAAAT